MSNTPNSSSTQESIETQDTSRNEELGPQSGNNALSRFKSYIVELFSTPPREGIADDLALILLVMAVQLPIFFLYSLVSFSGSFSNWIRVLTESIGFMVVIDAVLLIIFWGLRTSVKLVEKQFGVRIFAGPSITVLLGEFARFFLYVSNKFRRSIQPVYFFVHEKPKERRVIDIFSRGLVLSFLALIMPFQVRVVTSDDPAKLSLNSLDTWLFVLWSLVTIYFFVAWDLLGRSDLRYLDQDDATMKRFSSWWSPIIAFGIGILAYWTFTTNPSGITFEYLILGLVLLSVEFFLIVQILHNQETELDELLAWIREGYEKKSVRLN